MLARLRSFGIPDDQIVLFYADLGSVMWPKAMKHLKSTSSGLEIVRAVPASDFFEMVDRRGYFPTPDIRQCTSDLKRGPIEREIRRWLKARPDHSRIVVSCMGLRAEESQDRAKRPHLAFSKRNSLAGRQWYDWNPILSMTTQEVFDTIKRAGQSPHPLYRQGFSRYSCPFCFYASKDEHRRAAMLLPNLYAEYCAREVQHNHALSPTRVRLPERTGVRPSQSSVIRPRSSSVLFGFTGPETP